MRIILAGPCSTAAFRHGLNLALPGAPDGQIQTPIGPLAIELLRRGHHVHVVTLDPTVSERMHFNDQRFDISYLPMRSRAKQRALDLFAREIRALTREYQWIAPDIVHAHWTYEYAEAGVRSRLPLVVTAHDSPIDNILAYRQLYRMFRLAMALRTLFRVKHLTCVSEYLRPRLRALGFVRKIETIPNGVDVISLTAPAGKKLCKREPIIVTMGDVSRTKNVTASIAAFRKIRISIPGAKLHLFGAGLDMGIVKGEPGVFGHGPIEHPSMIEFLRLKATLVIHPSRQEVCPAGLIEAMACGVPCLAGRNSGGVRNLFPGALAECLVDIRDTDVIANKAVSILSSTGGWLLLSQEGRKNVEANYSIAKIVAGYERLYARILEELGRD